MAITYGFFNSVSGDRAYNADQMSNYFDGLVSDGVYQNVEEALMVKSISGLQVGVQAGRALIACKWLKNDAVHTITLNPAHVTLNRYTAIVARLDMSSRVMEIVAKDGTNASSPTVPEMSDTTTVKELCLAVIYVAAGATAITQTNITDTRGTDKCPWITGLIQQVDTSQLFLQWQTACEEYYAKMVEFMENLTSDLNVNAYLQEYKSRYTVTAATETNIPINIAQYDPTTDILIANINGVLFMETEDYTISGTGSGAVLKLNNSIKAGNIVEFRVIKSIIGIRSTT